MHQNVYKKRIFFVFLLMFFFHFATNNGSNTEQKLCSWHLKRAHIFGSILIPAICDVAERERDDEETRRERGHTLENIIYRDFQLVVSARKWLKSSKNNGKNAIFMSHHIYVYMQNAMDA